MSQLQYWNRIFTAYVLGNTSHLSFWHGTPEINPVRDLDHPKPYYMKFHYKANYDGQFDEKGIPMLDYHGNIGLKYNPIAIAQYGLGNYNLYLDHNDTGHLNKFYAVADWLVENLEPNQKDVFVWHHYFDFEYRDTLKAPWYSGLAQGLGLSVLVRAYSETGNNQYLDAIYKAYKSFEKTVEKGGVLFIDSNQNIWIEEYIVSPPTHILNGFLWALWGIYDFWIFLKDSRAKILFKDCVDTIEKNIHLYDTGYWSLYEQSGIRMKMLASPFYHDLHIIQLKIMDMLTNISIFQQTAERWENYTDYPINRYRAIAYKSLFKLIYY